MKRLFSMMVALACAVVLATGCAKKGQVDTSNLEKSFSSSEPSLKSQVEQAVASIKSENFAGATASLQKLLSEAKITPEQKQAISDVLSQLQQKIAETANKAAGEASKALGDLQKSVGK